MNREELEKRTLFFALKIIEFVATLPGNKTGEIVEFQLVKAVPRLAQITAKPTVRNRGMISSTSLELSRRSHLRVFTGWNYVTQPVLAPSSFVDGSCKSRENYWQSSQALAAPARQIGVHVRRETFLPVTDSFRNSPFAISQFTFRNPKF